MGSRLKAQGSYRCLYRKDYTSNKLLCSYRIKEFKPHIMKLFMTDETPGIKDILVRLNFYIQSKGKTKIFYVTSESNELMHVSCVVPYCWKFNFMGQDDYEIGPCCTKKEYRGRGIYPAVLSYITSLEEYSNASFWMIISESNKSSIRGVEKAGFRQAGLILKTKFLKNYRIVSSQE